MRNQNKDIREIEMYASSESWINNISIDEWFVMMGQYLKIWNLRVQKIVILRKSFLNLFLTMLITNITNYVLLIRN